MNRNVNIILIRNKSENEIVVLYNGINDTEDKNIISLLKQNKLLMHIIGISCTYFISFRYSLLPNTYKINVKYLP